MLCGVMALQLGLLASVGGTASLPTPSEGGQCGQWTVGMGFGPNMPGKPMQYALTAADCCAFCHRTAGCHYWTWNGNPPGNGMCYAKASNASGDHSSTMVSGGVDTGPAFPPSPPVRVELVSNTAVSVTEPTYASWNIDSSCNRGFHRTSFSNPNLLLAARGLAPSRLRFGGSGNDALVYGLTPGSPECADIPPATDCGYTTPGCLNASHWDSLFSLAKNSGSDFIFGVSYELPQACAEGASYVWNATNAGTLLAYLQQSGQNVWGFELGNEVNNNGGSPCNATPHAQAEATLTFAAMVKKVLPDAVMIGPDSGYRDWQAWLSAYLPIVAAESGVLHAVTHHVYAGVGRTSFNSPMALDADRPEIEWYTTTLRALAPGSQIWAGEDGPIGGGNSGTCGDPGTTICGTYASSVWYADDLANRALHGFVQYQRQALFGGAYGLTATAIDHQQSALGANEPLLLRPDYWLNFVWKRTVGTSVYNATSSSPSVRAYAFSGPPPSTFAAAECVSAHRQLLLINVDPGANATTMFAATGYSAWTLSPTTNASTGLPDPFSSRSNLNGQLLPQVLDGGAAPFLDHLPTAAVVSQCAGGQCQVSLPPLSISFICADGTAALQQ